MDFAAMLKAEKAKAKADAQSQVGSASLMQDDSPIPSVSEIDSGIGYCSNFISKEEEVKLIEEITNIPQNQWATLKQRRLLNLGGVPHPSGSWSEDLPDFIQLMICSKLVKMNIFKEPNNVPNQILLNEYSQGAGIDPHNDGPLFEPIVCIVSLGGDAIIDFFRDPSSVHNMAQSLQGGEKEKSVVLKQRSLFIFSDKMYLDYLHGISSNTLNDVVDDKVINMSEANVKIGDILERSTRRLSITIRVLSNVQKHISRFDVISDEEKSEQERREAWWFSSISEK